MATIIYPTITYEQFTEDVYTAIEMVENNHEEERVQLEHQLSIKILELTVCVLGSFLMVALMFLVLTMKFMKDYWPLWLECILVVLSASCSLGLFRLALWIDRRNDELRNQFLDDLEKDLIEIYPYSGENFNYPFYYKTTRKTRCGIPQICDVRGVLLNGLRDIEQLKNIDDINVRLCKVGGYEVAICNRMINGHFYGDSVSIDIFNEDDFRILTAKEENLVYDFSYLDKYSKASGYIENATDWCYSDFFVDELYEL